MQLLVITGVTVLLAIFAFWFANTYFKARISQELMADAEAFERLSDDRTKTLLVLGDSTGVGVGADKPEDTVPGLFAAHLGATYVENHSVIGAAVADLPPQIEAAALPRYDVILIQVGGNDVLPFGDVEEAAVRLQELVKTLPPSERVMLMSAGNVGGSTLFPPFIRPFHTAATLKLHEEFQKVANATGITYVNLYEPFWKDPFLRNPYRYLSRDGLHPSSFGYELWFQKLRKAYDGV